ncbi:MAG: hypothetical protein HZB51_29800 [Chloroflexi bacterium]|nr:hypothetical protein [Chloroflexota bacterium]
MVKFEFSFDEATLLHRALHDHLAELETEMAKNTLEGFPEILEDEKALIEKIIDQLEQHGIGISSEIFGGYPE